MIPKLILLSSPIDLNNSLLRNFYKEYFYDENRLELDLLSIIQEVNCSELILQSCIKDIINMFNMDFIDNEEFSLVDILEDFHQLVKSLKYDLLRLNMIQTDLVTKFNNLYFSGYDTICVEKLNNNELNLIHQFNKDTGPLRFKTLTRIC